MTNAFNFAKTLASQGKKEEKRFLFFFKIRLKFCTKKYTRKPTNFFIIHRYVPMTYTHRCVDFSNVGGEADGALCM